MIKNILIVEDELIAAEYLKQLIEDIGYNVIDIVGTGDEAIDIVTEQDVDLVLMDIFINGSLDGIETVKKMKAKKEINIIYITANTDQMTFNRAMETNAQGYLRKPISLNELEKLIKEIL